MSFDEFEPWEKYFDASARLTGEGLPIKAALERLARWEGDANSQAVAVDYLRSGVWRARARKADFRCGLLQNFGLADFHKNLVRLPGYGKMSQRVSLTDGIVSRDFWHGGHAIAGDEWRVEYDFLWAEGTRMQLERGIVEVFTGEVRDDVADGSFLGIHMTLFGVEIDPFDVDATAPFQLDTSARAARTTSYDWEGAFAHVAAKLYFDVQFEDVNARGTQVAIVDALRDYFQTSQMNVPEVSSLKAKAKKIVGALRSK